MVREELSERIISELRKQPGNTEGERVSDKRNILCTDLTGVWPV